MSTLKVNTIESETPNVTIADGLTVTGVGTVTTLNTTNLINATQLSNRNIIINGAMNVAQRGTSATSVSGQYKTVDRFSVSFSGEDEDPTEAQHTLTSSDTGPYAEGFRKSFHLTNGNQTGGAGASDYLQPQYKIEAQDIANSGWDYTSSSSYITISFWAKSSVTGDYTFNLDTQDGTGHRYLMEYSLVANTWKKITKTIPGNSNLTVNNDNGLGLQIMWYPFLGSSFIQADQENNWYASSNGKYGTVSTTSWWTTNDATWEITGVQLEVGSVATPFEHRIVVEELARCKRYYQQFPQNPSDAYGPIGVGRIRNATNAHIVLTFPEMRSSPTCAKSGNLRVLHAATGTVVNSVASSHMARSTVFIEPIVSSGLAQGEGCILTADNDSSGKITLSAEL